MESTQHVAAKEAQSLPYARLAEAIERTERIDAPKAEIVELVADAKAEITKPHPNGSRLRSLLSTTGDAVRTVAAIRPAYDAVKAACAAIGIDLP